MLTEKVNNTSNQCYTQSFRDNTESLRGRTEMYRDKNAGWLDTMYSKIAHKNCTHNNAAARSSGFVVLNAILVLIYFWF